MWLWRTFKRLIYWGGILGSISAIGYAVFVWQFPWYMHASGVTYLDTSPIQIFKPHNSPTLQVGAVHKKISPQNSLVAENQILFSVKTQKYPNTIDLEIFYNINQSILFDALLNSKNPVFLNANTPFEKRIVAYYEVAYAQDIAKLQQLQITAQQKIDTLKQKKPDQTLTDAEKQAFTKHLNAIPNNYVTHLKKTADTIRKQVFADIVSVPVPETLFIKSPINGIIKYADTTNTHKKTPNNNMPVAYIYPLDAPVAVRVYFPADVVNTLNKNTQVTVYHGDTLRIKGIIFAVDTNDTNAQGDIAVVVHLFNTYIHSKNTFILSNTPVQIKLAYGTGSIYQYIQKFLSIKL